MNKGDRDERPVKRPTLHINYIYRAQQYGRTSWKELKIACKKLGMVTSVNKVFPMNGNIIMFLDQDMDRVCTPHDDVLIVTLQIPHTKVSHTLVDGRAGVNMFFKDTMERMGLLNDITKTWSVMMTFEWTHVQTLGTLKLSIIIDPYSLMINFHVLDTSSPHNTILARNWIHIMKAVPSTYHQVIWYPTSTRVKENKGD